MSLDFQRVQEQVKELGELAPARQKTVIERRERAVALLRQYARRSEVVRLRVNQVVESIDPNLRCALPVDPALAEAEALDFTSPVPAVPARATVIAADGSQIPLDRHAEVEYCLINIGAARLSLHGNQAPQTHIDSRLLFDDALFTETGMITEATLAMMRDRYERSLLADLVPGAEKPVITFTDGPIELWGSRDGAGDAVEFAKQLQAYLASLQQLRDMDVVSAGYVDKPYANLVVRLLEVMELSELELNEIKHTFPLRGVTDLHLFRSLLQPGERSAVFAIQSRSARQYRGDLALHFFYLNVGRENRPALARVEIPAWVAGDTQKLDDLHAVLVEQCRLLGSRPYPYLLHRAHETAVVTLDERDQVTQMVIQELLRRGVEVGERSQKQAIKEISGRTGYKR